MDVLGIFWIPNWLLILLILTFTYVVYMSWYHGCFIAEGIDGPKPLPIIGNLFKQLYLGPAEADLKVCREYGKLFGCHEGRTPVMYVNDVELIKQVMVKDFTSFVDRRTLVLNGSFKKALTNLTGDEWRRMRNVVTPAFSAGKLKRMLPLINKAADKLLAKVDQLLKSGNAEINLKSISGAYTMDVIASTSFGLDLDSQKDANDPFVVHARKMMSLSLVSPVLLIYFFFPFMVPLLSRLDVSIFPTKSEEFFVSITKTLIEERRNVKSDRADILQLLVNAQKGDNSTENSESSSKTHRAEKSDQRAITDEEIIAQAMTFFIAGYDTTSTTISFFLYNLALNPECQTKLMDEINEKLESESDLIFDSSPFEVNNSHSCSYLMTYDRGFSSTTIWACPDFGVSLVLASQDFISTFIRPTRTTLIESVQWHDAHIQTLPDYDNINQLGYLEMCLNETMRLYPVLSRTERLCTAESKLNGYNVPINMLIAIPIMAIHLNPELWDDPNTFNPERFSPENKGKIHPYQYMPFGLGPRNCVGMRLALTEMKIAIVRTLQKFIVSSCEKTIYPPKMSRSNLLRTTHDLVVKFAPRE